jgi:hypothetical protein
MSNRGLAGIGLALPLVALISACSSRDTQPMTPEEVQTLKFRVSVEGVAFDVPVNYHHGEFETIKVWPRPPQAQVEGRKRPKVDVIRIYALLPDMHPYMEANAAEFDKPGWGKKARVYLTKRRANFKYFFDNFGQRLQRLPESPEVPGMLHFLDYDNHLFFSHVPIEPMDPNLVHIKCSERGSVPSPSCNIWTVYLDRFDLQIAFARSYLAQWRDIERKTKLLLDKFRESASQPLSPK